MKPLEITLIRHAESRANVAQRLADNEEPLGEYADVLTTHDSEVLLSPEGELQVARARQTLFELGLDIDYFDARIVSPLVRTMQTAAGLCYNPNIDWRIDGKLIERDWGHYGAVSAEERAILYPYFDEHWKTSKFYARQPNGQSISDVTFQFRAFLERAGVKYADQRIVAVTHGETMQAARSVMEKLTPHEWNDLKEAGELSVKNLQMIQWSRVKPDWYYENDEGDTGDRPVVDSFSSGWRRIINLADPDMSHQGRSWVQLDRSSAVTAGQLSDVVERFRAKNTGTGS